MAGIRVPLHSVGACLRARVFMLRIILVVLRFLAPVYFAYGLRARGTVRGDGAYARVRCVLMMIPRARARSRFTLRTGVRVYDVRDVVCRRVPLIR